MPAAAGKFRHFVKINVRSNAQGADGEPSGVYIPFYPDDIPAEIVPLSGKQSIERDAAHGDVTARCTIRNDFGNVSIDMQVVVTDDPEVEGIYYVDEVFPDPTLTGHLTLMLKGGRGNG